MSQRFLVNAFLEDTENGADTHAIITNH
jgi:hypothetical protein